MWKIGNYQLNILLNVQEKILKDTVHGLNTPVYNNLSTEIAEDPERETPNYY